MAIWLELKSLTPYYTYIYIYNLHIYIYIYKIQRWDGWVLTALLMSKNVWFFHHWAIRNWNLPWHVLKGNQTIVFAHQKVRFSYQTNWSFAFKTSNWPSKNADFPQNLPRSSASVLMPLWQHLRRLRPVRCSRLAVMGTSWYLGWIRGIFQNCKLSGFRRL